MNRDKFSKWAWMIGASLVLAAGTASAQTYAVLTTLDGSNGEQPGYGALVQGAKGDFYGTTLSGGSNTTSCSNGQGFGCGTIFQITTTGNLTTLYQFCSQPGCTDGVTSYPGLLKAANGNFYGSTVAGGASFAGDVFEITPEGTFSTIYSFCSEANCADGEEPYGGLVQAGNGNFYGTTTAGGTHGGGTIFELTPAGKLTTLYNFCSLAQCADGYFVWGNLMQSSNGKLYGSTWQGGANGAGTVFQITLAGKFTTLHSFTYKDGASPFGTLLQTSTASLLGTTAAGGKRNDGTVFEITTAGKLTTLYNFCAKAYCADGASPYAGLIEDGAGNFYGTTQAGGASSRGTVFQITSTGKLSTLYSFCSDANCADGAYPYAGLTLGSDGKFYGTTTNGGDPGCDVPYGCGVIFSFTK